MPDRHDAARADLHRRMVRDDLEATTRRAFLGRLGTAGVGALGLAMAASESGASLLGDPGSMADGFDLRRPHFAPRAKRIVYLHMAGSPPHHDLLDPKPVLDE